MKNVLLLTLLSIVATSLFAQEEFDENKEGFDHLPKGTIRKEVACFSNWSESEKNNSIKPGKTTVVKSGVNHMTFKSGNVSVTVKSKPFDKSKYKIKRNADGFVTTINDKQVFGVDGGLPSSAMQSVTITIGTDTLRLPQSAYANLFQPNFCSVKEVEEGQWGCPQIYFSTDKKRIYIFSTHSDAAGAYEVTWIIQDKKYLRRVVDYGY